MVTFERISNGHFTSYVNGVKSPYIIFNGDLGASGRGGNCYYIENLETGKITNAGTLQKAKKILTHWLGK